MKFSLDDRGVSEVLGAILVFALLISVLSIIQVSGVPALNEQVEFEHNANLQDDLRDFDASVDEAAATGVNQPVVIDTGVRYPPRLFLINPGPTSGTLSTTGDADVTFRNLSAVNPETRDYFEGDRSYTTTSVVYEPAYNQFRSAPETRYEHGTVYNADRRSGGIAVLDPSSVVSGRRISLTMLTGDLATSDNDAITLTVAPTSAPTTTVSVTNEATGAPLTISLRTDLSETTWEAMLAPEIDDAADGGTDDGRYVTDVRCVSGAGVDEPCNGELVIEFEEGYTYDLQLAEVSVEGTSAPKEAAYVTTIPTLDREVSETGGTVGAAVRDQYGNPVSGTPVRFHSPDGNFEDETVTTGADGIATTQFDPGDIVATASIWAGINRNGSDGSDNPFDNEARKDYISYSVSVTEANAAPSGGDINPVDPNSLFLAEVVLTDAATRGGGGKDGRYTLTFENIGDSDIVISQAKVNFYFVSVPGSSNNAASQPPKSAVITDVSESSRTANVVVRGSFKPFTGNITVPVGANETLQVDFYNDAGIYGNANNDDYFILTLITDGSQRTYFVVPGLTDEESSMADGVSAGSVSSPSDGQLRFDLTNNGAGEAVIETISVNSVSGTQAPNRISNPAGAEFRLASGTSLYDGTITVGGSPVTVTGSPAISASDSETFILETFKRQTGQNENNISLSGRTVTITVGYTDGSSGTYTLTVV